MNKEFPGKKACIAPEGVFIIGTYDENGVPNAMNAAWGAQMTSYDDATGILVGKIVAEQADESVLTDGKVDYDKLQPIIFDIATMTYRVVGPVVGKAFHDGMKLKG